MTDDNKFLSAKIKFCEGGRGVNFRVRCEHMPESLTLLEPQSSRWMFQLDIASFLVAIYSDQPDVANFLSRVLGHYRTVGIDSMMHQSKQMSNMSDVIPAQTLDIAKRTCIFLKQLDASKLLCSSDGIWVALETFPYAALFENFPPPKVGPHEICALTTSGMYILKHKLQESVGVKPAMSLSRIMQFSKMPLVTLSPCQNTEAPHKIKSK